MYGIFNIPYMDAMGNGLSFTAYFNGGDPNHLKSPAWDDPPFQERTVQLHQVQGHVSVEDTDSLGHRTLGLFQHFETKKRKKP